MGDILTQRYTEALAWAHELHREQVRKSLDADTPGIPYISHLLGVSSLVLEHGGDEDQAIAGLLHDSIEDQHQTDESIAERFGPRVAGMVPACTDSDTHPKPPWRKRKEAYVAHLATAPADALLVSLADKVHNARAIATDVAVHGQGYFEVFTGGPGGTRWYYAALADAFDARSADLPGSGVGLRTELRQAVARFDGSAIDRAGCTS